MVEPGGQHLFLQEITLPFKVAAYSREFGYLLHVPNIVFTSSIVISVFLLLSALSMRRQEIRFMDQNTGLVIRGIAIIFLLLGHLSSLVLDRPVFFTGGGPLAVIAFLFLSGYGIQKRYGLNGLKWDFWRKRLARLTFPLWLSLALFFLLDYIVYRRTYTIGQKVLPFLFYIVPDHNLVNSSAWFVTFILLNYLIYFVASRLNVRLRYKIVFLCSVIAAVFILLTVREFKVTELWRQYLVVFPVGIILAMVVEKYSPPKIINNRLVLILLITVLGVVTYIVTNRYALLRPFSPILVILLLGRLMSITGFTSRFLEFLGRYSYEIFLIHLPFMMRFDFVLYQWPLYISFFVYLSIVLVLSVTLSKTSDYLNSVVLNGRWIPSPLRGIFGIKDKKFLQ